MSQENVELVRRGVESFAAGEILWDTIGEDVEIRDHDILDAGEYRGHAGFTRWVEDWGEGWPVISWQPQEFIDAGDEVVAFILVKARARGSSIDLERQDGIVYTVRDGKIVRLDYFNSRQQALEAVGLAE
jgi:ketosteroid isomerase-like protein